MEQETQANTLQGGAGADCRRATHEGRKKTPGVFKIKQTKQGSNGERDTLESANTSSVSCTQPAVSTITPDAACATCEQRLGFIKQTGRENVRTCTLPYAQNLENWETATPTEGGGNQRKYVKLIHLCEIIKYYLIIGYMKRALAKTKNKAYRNRNWSIHIKRRTVVGRFPKGAL